MSHEAEELKKRNTGVKALDNLYAELSKSSPNGIITSKHPNVVSNKALVDTIPPDFGGVTRWYIPIAPKVAIAKDGTHRYYSSYVLIEPKTIVPLHANNFTIGELIVVLTGSIVYLDQEYTVGDWLWIPPFKEYTYHAGEKGAYLLNTWPSTETTTEDIKHPQDPLFQTTGLGIIHAVDANLDALVHHGLTTSKDPLVIEAFKKLEDPLPFKWPGVKRWFFPFAYRAPDITDTDGRYLVYIAHIGPNTTINEHTHPQEKLADKRVVLSGSITLNGKELTAGQMAWITAGSSYSFTTGKLGAVTIRISCHG